MSGIPAMVGFVIALVVAPQALWVGFYKVLARVCDLPAGGDGECALKLVYVLGAIALLIGSVVVSAWYVSDYWLPERRRLRQQREKDRAALLAQIDTEVGIPRIPRAR